MPNEIDPTHESVGAWAKRYYITGRSLVDSILSPHDLGWTQWLLLNALAERGPTRQREVGVMLQVERPTLSTIVATLVRKGFIDQAPDSSDQRQRILTLTESGRELWESLPSPIDEVLQAAFAGIDEADLATARRVLREATRRLSEYHTQRRTT